jgi:hypothetical protein
MEFRELILVQEVDLDASPSHRWRPKAPAAEAPDMRLMVMDRIAM